MLTETQPRRSPPSVLSQCLTMGFAPKLIDIIAIALDKVQACRSWDGWCLRVTFYCCSLLWDMRPLWYATSVVSSLALGGLAVIALVVFTGYAVTYLLPIAHEFGVEGQ